MSQLTIVEAESPAIAPPKQDGIMQLLGAAIGQGAAPESIRELVQILREEREHTAKMAFNQAMQRCQERMKVIGKDADNPHTKSRYATYEKLDRALRPLYAAEGFALSFNTAESPADDCIRILGDVSHRDGYTKTYQIDMPADGKGAQGRDVMTKTHATGSATKYGMRYLLTMIFNVATGKDDDDGNKAGGVSPNDLMPEETLDEWIDLVKASASFDELKKNYKDAQKAAETDPRALLKLEQAKNAALTSLGKAKA